ncbi:uncharacterized protein LOC133731157 [Rosa rugosa]|uniref:uncharacterized protein LOC133731157 n=1 Tax=Rosa rugosa TaxID=74645 RepID=UPI002B405E69|nr:uncharacterized protein LOC133731157 [Rosa rugosa]
MVSRDFHLSSLQSPAPNPERSDSEERQCKRLKPDQGSSYTHRSVLSQLRPSYESFKTPKSYDTSKLPSGWLDCSSFGEELDCMIPSKMPLGESYNVFVPHGKRYSFKQVIEAQRCRRRKLGLVIDLTNTTHYYRTCDLVKMGIKHVRIPCNGRNSVPDNFSVNRFVYEVMRFKEYYPEKYILVHCTHGHNRTGYMIIHYLMRTQPMRTVTQAIKDFAQARPPGIYKPDYINALYSFYHEMKPVEFVCPPSPEWKRSSEFVPDDNDQILKNSHQDRDTDGVVITNDDILGDDIPDDQQEELRRLCYKLLKAFPRVRGRWQFPGSHPVSLNWENLQLLRQQSYYATWKADGTRYMMLITIHGCYLIDRSFNFRRVQMRFPRKHLNGSTEKSTHHCTLLDGEMVIDTEHLPGPQKKQTRRYLVYDMMALNNGSVVEWPFQERSKKIEEQVIEPRTNDQRRVFESRSNNPDYRYDLEPFRVRMKGFWPLSKVKKILKEFIPKLSHDADGVIFQGMDDPYVIRKHERLVKWKYPEMNSVDFLFEVGGDGRQLLYLYAYGEKQLMKGERVAFKDSSEHYSFYSGKIIECFRDSEKKEWVYMRSRTDKSTPNDVETYKKVKKSIEDNITEDVLLKEIDNIILLPMYVEQHANSARLR